MKKFYFLSIFSPEKYLRNQISFLESVKDFKSASKLVKIKNLIKNSDTNFESFFFQVLNCAHFTTLQWIYYELVNI